jgi:aldose 1-epimerase
MEQYGTLPDGRPAHLFTLTNKNGLIARVTDYGAHLVSLDVPNSEGGTSDLTLGYDSLDNLLQDPAYLGATVGRFGNRIAHGRFTLDGETHTLATNNDPGGVPCHLHGGEIGFNQKLWSATQEGNKLTLTTTSPDGEEGYPGTLAVTVIYELNEDNELLWQVTATTDRATPVNIINHTYWNLTGDPEKTIINHEMMIASDHFLQTNAGMIPDGSLTEVAGTPLDFTTSTRIGARIEEDHLALTQGNGYDHCWVLREGEGLQLAAIATDPESGRRLEIHTDQPGVHFYTGNFLDASVPGKSDIRHHPRTGFCLETEAFPDAPNQESFSSAILRPGETYTHSLLHKFSW